MADEGWLDGWAEEGGGLGYLWCPTHEEGKREIGYALWGFIRILKHMRERESESEGECE